MTRSHSLARGLVIAVAIAALPALSVAQDRPASRGQGRGPQSSRPAPKVLGEVKHLTVTSKLLGRAVNYLIYTAPHAEGTRLPCVVFLHGLFESPKRWESRGGAQMFDKAVAAKQIQPCIVVVPDGGMTFYTDSIDGKEPYARFLVEEFIPEVDKTAPTLHTRAGRAIAGSSMGGFGALKIGLLHRDLFCAVAAHSAVLLPAEIGEVSQRAQRTMRYVHEPLAKIFGDPIEPAAWRAANPMAIAATMEPKGLPAIYFDCGTEDSYGFDEGCRALDVLLTKRSITHESTLSPGGHGWDFLATALPRGAAFIDKAFRAGAAGATPAPLTASRPAKIGA